MFSDVELQKNTRVMILMNSKSIGGAERAMNILANKLVYENFDVVLIPINSGTADLIKPQVESWSPERKWQGGLWDTLIAIFKIARFAKKWQPDVLILNCDIAEFCGTFVQLRTPKIVVEHTTKPWNTRKTLGRIIRHALFIQESIFVAVSKHMTIWPWGKQPKIVINNLVTPQDQVKQNYEIERVPGLVFVGRLSTEKGPLVALEIAKQSNLRIRFFGDGPLREEIYNLAEAQNIEVTLEGFVPTVWDFVSSEDILVVPSEWEGDGLVVLEAITNRIPILIADIPAFRQFELWEELYCSDVNEFTLKVKESINNPKRLIVDEEIRDKILESRDVSEIMYKWSRIIRECSDNKSHRE